MNKLTALVEAAKAATPGPWIYRPMTETEDPEIGATNGSRVALLVSADMTKQNSRFIALANPATVLKLCALLEKAEAAMNSPSGRKYIEALAAIKQWKEQT